MKNTWLLTLLSCIALIGSARGEVILNVALDPPAVGPSYFAGDTVTANLVMELTTPTDLGAYNFSVEYDSNELTFLSATNNGFFSLAPFTNPTSAAGSNVVRNFDGFVLAANSGETAPRGPTTAGVLQFRVNSVLGLDDSGIDIRPRLSSENPSEDAFFTIAGAQLADSSLNFSGASVNTIAAVPEPTSLAALGIGAVALYRHRRRRR